MATVESVVEKQGKNGPIWIAVIDGKEVMAFNREIMDFKGKDCPYPIAKSQSGKEYIQFPKAGGFQGKSGGGWKGKSDKELYLQALTMSMAYAKDIICSGITPRGALINLYKEISTNILADLKALCPDVPEAPKQEVKTFLPQKTPERQVPPPPPDTSNMTVKEKLQKEMWDYLRNTHSDTDDNFRTLLMSITAFTGKDGNEVSMDNFDKLSEKWAGSSIKKLRELVEEEDRKTVANADLGSDVNF